MDDLAANTNYTTDIDDQASSQYTYDGNGNLTADPSEEIQTRAWYANGKIKSITRTGTSTKSDLEFIYDASGNRIVKITKPRDGTNVKSQLHWTYTYYVRDASGNVMAVYERTFATGEGLNEYEDRLNCAELHIYGSKRVGTNNVDSLSTRIFTDATFVDIYNNTFNPTYTGVTPVTPCTTHCKSNYRRELGNKQYEVTNHLGNVLATVSDRRLSEDNYAYTSSGSGNYNYDAIRNVYYAVTAGTGTYNRVTSSSDLRADWYTADVISYSDYYAFGAQMDGRFGGQYRYGFNGQDALVEINGSQNYISYDYRICDSRLGRFLSIDPLAPSYPRYSPYHFSSNQPIHAPELEGLESAHDLDINDPNLHNLSGRPYGNMFLTPEYKNFNEARSTAFAVATAVAIDLYFFKGRGSMFLFSAQAFSIFEHNTATTSEGKMRQRRREDQNLVSLFYGAGVGIGIGNVIRLATPIGGELAWRTMSYSDYLYLEMYRELPASWSGETFISTRQLYASQYLGRPRYDVLVEFNMARGTYGRLASLGVKDGSRMNFGLDMPAVSPGWTRGNNVYFKSEQGTLNLGLGRNGGLNEFNRNIVGFRAVAFANPAHVTKGIGVLGR